MNSAILFDLDNTLYEYGPCNEAALIEVHGELSEVVPISLDDFRSRHDAAREGLAARLQGQAASHNRVLFFKRIIEGLVPEMAVELSLKLYDLYWHTFMDEMRLAPSAPDVLATLARDHKLAIVSNHTTAVQLRKIEKLGLTPYFSAVITSEEVGVEKPHARIFEAALTAVGVDGTNALMVGDDFEADIKGAQAAGLRTIMSTEFASSSSSTAGADAVVDSLGDVPGVVAGLLNP